MRMTVSIATALLLTASAAFAGDHGTHWGYTGHTGPEHWGDISEKFHICSTGMNQSPINIIASFDADLPAIGFRYKSAPTEILNNGHTVQVNVADGSTMTIEGHTYTLKQYHFHTPSENHIGGKEFPLEAHFVHADAEGNLAVVGVMFEEGAENAELAKLWAHMPMEAGEHHTLTSTPEAVTGLLPSNGEYYRFNGSLTTPPCSEGVKWMVMKTPLNISKAQVEQFSHAIHGHNNRPIQPVNARVVAE
jgi:carbonic anhydrase